ncbi:hypothetical protein SCP_1103690 [Sparassis crispa]|uniref:Uncharacterized protein n=1 Tax=Sparassis crispa TaxID=139825 RepID=A0A401GZW1_9APHY|nr:hypothetical protein SCP_1103690 [Sparassis crispa]GBE87692.1 hypothetical protein SCP_1103690 [Sparassis crispa]
MASVTDAPATTTGSKCKMRHLSPSTPVPSPAKRQKPKDSDDIFLPTAHTDSTASDTPADDAHASHRPDETPGKPYRNKGKCIEKTRTPTEVLQSLLKLRETLAVTCAINNVFVLVQPMYLKRAFPSNIAERLDHVSITTAHDIINLTTADPTALHFVTIGASDYLQLKTSTHLTLFSVVGSITHSDLISPSGRSRQLCVAPSALTWPRAAAVLGAILNRRTLIFPSFHAGLSFSTRLTTSTSNTPAKICGMAPATPVNAQRGPPPVLPADRDVPTFDGCKPFKFSMRSISMLPKIHDDLSTESAVLLLFTLGKDIKSHPELDDENADTTISLNIQSIVLLANPGLMPHGFLEDEPMPLLRVFQLNFEPDQHLFIDCDMFMCYLGGAVGHKGIGVPIQGNDDADIEDVADDAKIADEEDNLTVGVQDEDEDVVQEEEDYGYWDEDEKVTGDEESDCDEEDLGPEDGEDKEDEYSDKGYAPLQHASTPGTCNVMVMYYNMHLYTK